MMVCEKQGELCGENLMEGREFDRPAEVKEDRPCFHQDLYGDSFVRWGCFSIYFLGTPQMDGERFWVRRGD